MLVPIQDLEIRVTEIEARLGLIPRAKSIEMGYEP